MQVQVRYVKENTPQNYQDCVSLCSQNHVFKLVGKSNWWIRIQKNDNDGYSGVCVQNAFITIAN